MKSPLNYLGGKSRLTKRIIPMIPHAHICYCEPFCGAAWILFAKEPSKVEVINDADGELVNFWRIIQNHLQPFLEYYKYAVISRKLFELENEKRPHTLTDIQRAVRYFYIQKLGFGGRTHGRTFGVSVDRTPGLNLATIEEALLEVHWRIARVAIEHMDAVDCITRYDRPDTFFYIDPPYWETAGYAVPWSEPDFIRLRDALLRISGRFILSINDCQEVRHLFSGFKIRTVKTTYSTGDSRTQAAGSRKEQRSELLITRARAPDRRTKSIDHART